MGNNKSWLKQLKIEVHNLFQTTDGLDKKKTSWFFFLSKWSSIYNTSCIYKNALIYVPQKVTQLSQN